MNVLFQVTNLLSKSYDSVITDCESVVSNYKPVVMSYKSVAKSCEYFISGYDFVIKTGYDSVI